MCRQRVCHECGCLGFSAEGFMLHIEGITTCHFEGFGVQVDL